MISSSADPPNRTLVSAILLTLALVRVLWDYLGNFPRSNPMGVEKLSRFRSKLEVLRSERERLTTEMRKLTHQIEEIDHAIQNCLRLRAQDLQQEQRQRSNMAARKRK